MEGARPRRPGTEILLLGSVQTGEPQRLTQIRDGRPGAEGVGSHAGGLGALSLEVVNVCCLSRGHLHGIRNKLSTNHLCPLKGEFHVMCILL